MKCFSACYWNQLATNATVCSIKWASQDIHQCRSILYKNVYLLRLQSKHFKFGLDLKRSCCLPLLTFTKFQWKFQWQHRAWTEIWDLVVVTFIKEKKFYNFKSFFFKMYIYSLNATRSWIKTKRRQINNIDNGFSDSGEPVTCHLH